MKTLESKKNLFLDRYNFDRSRKVAIAKAIGAASQHNLLYSKECSANDRTKIKEHWGACLEEIGNEFKKLVTHALYETMIAELKKI